MIELPDDELDRLFRKSSEELDPYFDPNDWNDLKKRLDAEDGIRPGGWLRKWIPFGVLLLFLSAGVGSYYLQKDSKTALPKSKAAVNKVLPSKSDGVENVKGVEDIKSGIESKENVKATEVEKENREKTSELPSEKEKLTKSKTGKILPLNRSKAGGVYLEPNRTSGKVGEGAFSSNNKKRIRQSGSEVNEVTSSKKERKKDNTESADLIVKSDDDRRKGRSAATEADQSAINNPNKKANDLVKADAANGNEIANSGVVDRSSKRDKTVVNATAEKQSVAGDIQLQLAENRLPESFNLSPLASHAFVSRSGMALPKVVSVESVTTTSQPVKFSERSPKMAVRFGYSPDLSSVWLKGFSKPGASVSLIAEYEILKRLYLQSGVIWSNKTYSADSGDYQIPKKLHYYGPPAKSVDGICKVFELPVNLRFDVYQGKTSRWFAGLGTSSYHMNAETYYYHFENEMDPKITPADRGWHGSTGWYWFSHLNASLGYEYRVTRRLSLVAEPYIRVPLRRVGYGNIKLLTTGVWISVRYTPFH
jgi:hypothetical protein